MSTQELGTQAQPFIVAPVDWKSAGVPWGSFCKCSVCELVAQSTVVFDFYADAPGDPLVCESCLLGLTQEAKDALLQIQAEVQREGESK